MSHRLGSCHHLGVKHVTAGNPGSRGLPREAWTSCPRQRKTSPTTGDSTSFLIPSINRATITLSRNSTTGPLLQLQIWSRVVQCCGSYPLVFIWCIASIHYESVLQLCPSLLAAVTRIPCRPKRRVRLGSPCCLVVEHSPSLPIGHRGFHLHPHLNSRHCLRKVRDHLCHLFLGTVQNPVGTSRCPHQACRSPAEPCQEHKHQRTQPIENQHLFVITVTLSEIVSSTIS